MDTDKNLSVRWLQILATLLGLSFPTVALLLRSNLENYLSLAKPEWLTQIIVFLLGIIGLVLTLFVLQRPWLRWDAATSTWVNRFTNIRYCAKCRVDKKISPLGNDGEGWRCPSCLHWWKDPTHQPAPAPKKRQRSERI